MSTTFYRAFEDRHRGSRELISKRLEAYLPFANPLKTLYPSCPALDLGCGRGEWLELLQAQGFSARGVDLDDGMLDACRALDLNAEHGDALSALAALEDNSQVVVSAFHLVEHIPFHDVQTLVSEALRVLKPAGLLIMETPNAENLVVGTSSFFLDPTHERPVPLDLLNFLAEYSGFSRTKVLRLQEDATLQDSQHLTLMDVLGGASPDYAVVAQKAATAEQLAIFDACFDRGYGVSLESLAQRYEQQMQQRVQTAFDKLHLPEIQEQLVDIKAELQQVRQQSDEAFEKYHLPALQKQFLQFKAELQQVNEQRDELFEKFRLPTLQEQLVNTEAELQKAREQRDEALAKAHEFWLKSCADDSIVQALTRSTSWRLTAPLRWSMHTIRTAPGAVVRGLKDTPRRVLGAGVRFVLARPALHQGLNKALKRSPRLYMALKGAAHNHGMVTDAALGALTPDNSVPQHLDGLSVEARQIYHDLKKAIDEKDRG